MSIPRPLTGNALKLLAAAFMVADHVGLLFFPGKPAFRLAGRLAYPIFAFMIAEGCHYTRSKGRYFLSVFLLGAVCQLVYFLVDGSWYLSILITFSLAILLIYAFQAFQRRPGLKSAALFAASLGAVWVINRFFTVDYGFFGCLVPLFAALPRNTPFDRPALRVLSLGLGLGLLSWDLGGNQVFCLLALPLLLAYGGKRGKRNMKYFFYIFYPLHLAVLQGLAWLTA